MKKILPFVLVFTILIVPTFVHAAWWNPFSWFKSKTPPQQEVVLTSTTTPVTTSFKKEVSSQTPTAIPTITSTRTKTTVKTEATDLLFCNNKHWAKCDAGSKFICPATGDPSCELPPQPPQGTLCNGVRYASCPSGSTLLCPADGSVASCQSIQSTYNTSVESQSDSSVAISNRNNALDAYNLAIKGYAALHEVIKTDLEGMEEVISILGSDQGKLATIVRDYTNARIKRIRTQEETFRQLNSYLQSEKTRLENQPISYFATYQLPGSMSNSDDFYTLLQAIEKDSDRYNSFLKEASSLPLPTRTSTRCTYRAPDVMGYGSIECY